ncbi:hypothetical protein QBC36DRAFT_250598 [Triangularia setosa]|uniref:Uncharacterized protein n=1 Tax=Triangularia setosa TaxID=2587417 RepID=A0AAN6VX62_9PEZI|nr:hypothetical protein QBC36DRAFT_250598 [Podospora setosa]
MDDLESLDPDRRCYCGKVYQTHASLLRHSRTCPALSEDCKSILRILACLGPRPVPADLFYRGLFPFKTWNENGNESFDRLAKLEPVFSNFARLDRAVQVACAIPAVQPTDSLVGPDTESYPWWADRDLAFQTSCRIFVRNELSRNPEQLLCWQRETVRLILHSFPHQDLDAKFIEKGRAFFPFVLPALQGILADTLHLDEIRRGVDVCIAASAFGAPYAKNQILDMAQSLLRRASPSPLGLVIQLRQTTLRLLNGEPAVTTFHPESGRKGNALLGEYLLIQAQSAAEQGHISRSWQLLDQWAPAYAAQPSLLESIMSFRFDLMKGKLSRYQGAFEKSRLHLEALTNQYPAPRAQFLSQLHLIAVYGELALWDRGKTLLAGIVATTNPRKRLFQLSRAEFHLARGLDGSDDDISIAKKSFVNLSAEYEEVVPARLAAKRNFARVCLGLAIISHMQRRERPYFALLHALNDWRLAYEACLGSSIFEREPGFPALICLLSIAEIKVSLDDFTWTNDLHSAQELWAELRQRESDQRFFFANIGTRWANMVCNWLEEAGKVRVLPQWVP